jgi:hypothetical protein
MNWKHISNIIILVILLFSCNKKTEYIEEVDWTYYNVLDKSKAIIGDNLIITIQLVDLDIFPEEYKTDRNNIFIQCTIENTSTFPEEVHLKEHDRFSTYRYSTSFFINIMDIDGNILLEDYTFHINSSTIRPVDEWEEPGDQILLYPNKKIKRTIALKDILWPILDKMNVGKYLISISLIYSNYNNYNKKKYISNIIEINILK